MEPYTDIMPSMSHINHNGVVSSFNGLPLVITVTYAFIGFTGIVGNGLVIYVLVRTSLARHIPNIFIMNQSAIDLFTSTMLICCYLTPEANLSNSDLPIGLARFTCTFWLSKYLFWGAVMASTGNLMCLTLERYMAVRCPLRYRRLFRRPRSLCLAVLPWVLGYAYQSYWLTLQYVDPATGECVHGSPGGRAQKIIGCVAFVVQYILPLSFMAFVYTSIAKSLQNRVGTATEASGPERRVISNASSPRARCLPPVQQPANDGRDFRSRARRNVIKTLFFVCVSFCVCWTPNQICYFYYNLGGDIDYESPLFFATISIAFCNMVANPFIYALSYRQFRQGMKQTLPLWRARRNDTLATVVNSTLPL